MAYWRLPTWIPIGLRNWILSFEPVDRTAFEANCRAYVKWRYGNVGFPDDWKLAACVTIFKARDMGVSYQWLAAQRAIPAVAKADELGGI